MKPKVVVFAAIAVALTLVVLTVSMVSNNGETIICASTTSTQNSGLFDHILPLFTESTGITVRVVAQGTGAALESGKRGDVDVVFVHAKNDEVRLVAEGYFVNRREVMFNDFIVLGPPDDPAGIGGSGTAAEALTRIAENRSVFVSRGDDSGTHKRERTLWKTAGIKPEGKWYLEVGQGMAKAMRVANEKGAYTLADRGTWFAIKDELDIAVLYEGCPSLFNLYSVMAVNPQRHANVRYDAAMEFIEWLVSDEGQRAIGEYRIKGEQLFIPLAAQ